MHFPTDAQVYTEIRTVLQLLVHTNHTTRIPES